MHFGLCASHHCSGSSARIGHIDVSLHLLLAVFILDKWRYKLLHVRVLSHLPCMVLLNWCGLVREVKTVIELRCRPKLSLTLRPQRRRGGPYCVSNQLVLSVCGINVIPDAH